MFDRNPVCPSPVCALRQVHDLQVLYEDVDVIVVSKPSGLLSVPGRGAHMADCVEARARMLHDDAMIVHRLDQATSGVMVLARNPLAHRTLSRQFELRQIGKVYLARVWGAMAQDRGVVDAPLMRDWPNRPRQMIDFELGRPAVTAWQVLERESNATRLRLVPTTGRTHQLRVHMLSLGHPILGDQLYAHELARSAVPRLQLHAQSIAFRHPVSGRDMTFEDASPF